MKLTPKSVVLTLTSGPIVVDAIECIVDDHLGRVVELVHAVQRCFVVEVAHRHYVLLGADAVPPQS
jgi:hypothetical protein